MTKSNPTRNGLRIIRETAPNRAKYGTCYPTPEQIAEYERQQQAQNPNPGDTPDALQD